MLPVKCLHSQGKKRPVLESKQAPYERDSNRHLVPGESHSSEPGRLREMVSLRMPCRLLTGRVSLVARAARWPRSWLIALTDYRTRGFLGVHQSPGSAAAGLTRVLPAASGLAGAVTVPRRAWQPLPQLAASGLLGINLSSTSFPPLETAASERI